MDLPVVGRALLVVGLTLAALGAVLTLAPSVPLLGRLPGDMRLGGDGWSVYVPLGTSILLSLALTLALGAVSWLTR